MNALTVRPTFDCNSNTFLMKLINYSGKLIRAMGTAFLETGHVVEEDINAVLKQFVGEIWQTAPLYSALKVHGHRMSDLVRWVHPFLTA